jgi:hypothetical protein
MKAPHAWLSRAGGKILHAFPIEKETCTHVRICHLMGDIIALIAKFKNLKAFIFHTVIPIIRLYC